MEPASTLTATALWHVFNRYPTVAEGTVSGRWDFGGLGGLFEGPIVIRCTEPDPADGDNYRFSFTGTMHFHVDPENTDPSDHPGRGQVEGLHRWYSYQSSFENGPYTGAAQFTRHMSISEPGGGGQVQVRCGSLNDQGTTDFALTDMWVIWEYPHPDEDRSKWMEISTEYRCPPGMDPSRYVRIEYKWNETWWWNRIHQITSPDYSSTHLYWLEHNNTRDNEWRWKDPYDSGWALVWSGSAPYGIHVDYGTEITDHQESDVWMDHHTYGSVQYRNSPAPGGWIATTWDGPGRVDFPTMGGHRGTGWLHACTHDSSTCH